MMGAAFYSDDVMLSDVGLDTLHFGAGLGANAFAGRARHVAL
jgi:hypothetical protein